jgi:predicted ATPase
VSGIPLEAWLARLTHSELVRDTREPEQAYLFKHALVQDTAYQSLLKNERRAFHLAAARALETCYPDALDENAARLAEHYWLAEEWARAAEFSQRAGAGALRVYAMNEAMAHFERATLALAFFRRNEMIPSLVRVLETLAQVYEMQARPQMATSARAEAARWQAWLAGATPGA